MLRASRAEFSAFHFGVQLHLDNSILPALHSQHYQLPPSTHRQHAAVGRAQRLTNVRSSRIAGCSTPSRLNFAPRQARIRRRLRARGGIRRGARRHQDQRMEAQRLQRSLFSSIDSPVLFRRRYRPRLCTLRQGMSVGFPLHPRPPRCPTWRAKLRCLSPSGCSMPYRQSRSIRPRSRMYCSQQPAPSLQQQPS